MATQQNIIIKYDRKRKTHTKATTLNTKQNATTSQRPSGGLASDHPQANNNLPRGLYSMSLYHTSCPHNFYAFFVVINRGTF